MARRSKPAAQAQLSLNEAQNASLVDEARRRYLNYALSVITARALPDVRDGLKPVHRRILYTMLNELRLRPDAKYRKSAAVVGDVMGKFHPHGDSAIYDALVRLAQSFSMRSPLVDGRGNFGSPDGDSPAAMRYTEAKLKPLALELLSELNRQTVAFRPNYDGTRFEPVVLPARFPNLLVNGSQGIAVGMATAIPPHNPAEVIRACIALIDDPEISLKRILGVIKGPDFPTGGELMSSKRELAEVYSAGQGTLRLRGQWKSEAAARGSEVIVITSIPYAVERSTIVAKIAEVIVARKLPVLLDVRDESTDDCRIVCEIKKGSDPQLIMAYLYKHTPLQTNVQVNLTCLVPTAQEDVAAPARLDLKSMLRQFLDFRMDVVQKRLAFDLAEIEKRIHILEGFETVFDVLDETIRIIRRSDGRQDAAKKLIKRFALDEEQVFAILDLRLYKLAKLEILLIRKELAEKRKEAARLAKLLKSRVARWKLIRGELESLLDVYGLRRLTKVVGQTDEPQYDAEAFIVDEDAMALVTAQGWVKRQQRIKDLSTTRVRDGDRVMSVVAGSTRSSIAFFSSAGSCYVTRLVDLPSTSGYGVPVQSLFKMADGERIIAMMGFDARFLEVPEATPDAEPEPPYAMAVTRRGMTLSFSLSPHREPSTRNGRRYCRLGEDDEVLLVDLVDDSQYVACVTEQGRALICSAEEVPLLSGPGKGVMLIKLGKEDRVLGAAVLTDQADELVAQRGSGTRCSISLRKYEVVSRAGKGFALVKRGGLDRILPVDPALPEFPEE